MTSTLPLSESLIYFSHDPYPTSPKPFSLLKLRVIIFRNVFYLKFNTHTSIRFSIYRKVALRIVIARKPTIFYKLIYYTSLRHLGK